MALLEDIRPHFVHVIRHKIVAVHANEVTSIVLERIFIPDRLDVSGFIQGCRSAGEASLPLLLVLGEDFLSGDFLGDVFTII